MSKIAAFVFRQLRKADIRKSTALVLIMTMLISIVMPAGVSYSGVRQSGGWDVTWSMSSDADEGRIELGEEEGLTAMVAGDEPVYLNLQLIPQGDGLKRFNDTFRLTIPKEIYEAMVAEQGSDMNEWFAHDEYPLLVTTSGSAGKASGSNLASSNNAADASGSDADGRNVTLLLAFPDELKAETEAGMSSLDYQLCFIAPQAMDLLLVQDGNNSTLTMEARELANRMGVMSMGDIYEFGPSGEFFCAADFFKVTRKADAIVLSIQVTVDAGDTGYDYQDQFLLQLAGIVNPQFGAGSKMNKIIVSNDTGTVNEWTGAGQTVNPGDAGYLIDGSDAIHLQLNDASDLVESNTWTLEMHYKSAVPASDFAGAEAELADGTGRIHQFHVPLEVNDGSVHVIFRDTAAGSTAQSEKYVYEDSKLFGIDYNGTAVGQSQRDYWTGIDLNTGADTNNRFLGWNTAEDGSGTWYRGGYMLTAEDINMIKTDLNGEMVLYQQYVNRMDLISLDFSKVKPQIYLEGENDHKTVDTAFEVDHAQDLHYMSTLDYSTIYVQMTTLWGRIDEFEMSNGTLTAHFDSRLEFEDEVTLLFESPWLVPKDVTYVQGNNENQYVFTARPNDSSEPLVNRDNGKWTAKIPVKLKDKAEIAAMSLDDFLQPMTLTLSDNYDLGINAVITRDSFNAIALSDNPVIEAGGNITLTIKARAFPFPITRSADAESQYARLFPTGSVEIQYVDTAGNPLKNLHTMSGRVDAAYNVDVPDIPGYRYLYEENNKLLYGNYELATQEYVLVYEVDPGQGDVTVDYVDTAGNTLLPQIDMSGDLNTGYTIVPPAIAGYTYIGEQNSKALTGSFQNQPQAYILVYEKNRDPEGSITVRYIDTAGNELLPGSQADGTIGSAYTVVQPTIDGYTYIGEQNNKPLSGTYNTDTQNYVLVYEKIPDPIGSIIIRYVDNSGRELLTSTGMTGRGGETYTVVVPSISGYNYSREENNRNLNGSFTDETVTYVLIYTKRGGGGGGGGGGTDPTTSPTKPAETTPAETTGPNPTDPTSPTNPPGPTVPGETTPGGGGIIVDIPPGEVIIKDKDGNIIFEGYIPDGKIPLDLGPGQYQLVVIGEDGVPLAYILDMGGLPKTGDSRMTTVMLLSLQLLTVSGIAGLIITKRRKRQ